MAGIFGIIGDISKSNIFEKSLKYLDFYKSNSIIVNDHTLLGITAFDPYSVEIFEKENYIIIIAGEYYGDDMDATWSRSKIFDLFQQYGCEFIHHIDGIFNILIFDKLKNLLYIFNDWAGGYNLFYYYKNNQFIFTTEIKGITKIVPSLTLNKRAMIEQLMFSHMLYDHYLFNEIKLLGPASILKYTAGNFEVINYFDLKNKYKIQSGKSESEYIDQLYEYFEIPTKKYLNRPDIALPLTGGTDSRLLLHYILKHNYQPKLIFTGESDQNDDVKIARKICKRFNLNHRTYPIDYHFYKINFFDNYKIHDGLLPPLRYSTMRKRIFPEANFIIQYPYNNTTFGDRFTPNSKKYIGEFKANKENIEWICNYYLKVSNETVKLLFEEEFWLYDEIKNELITDLNQFIDFPSVFIFDYFTWYQHCRRVVNLGAMDISKLTGRLAPSQDKDLILFAFNLPFKYRYWEYLLKKMITIKAPDLAKIRREGTNVPLSWPENVQMFFKYYHKNIKPKFNKKENSNTYFFRSIVNDKIDKILNSEKLKKRNTFNNDFIRRIWHEHLNGKNHAYLIHNIINIELFYREFIDG